MKNICKYIIVAIIVTATIFLFSCIRLYSCEATGEYFVANNTDKEIAIRCIVHVEYEVKINRPPYLLDTIYLVESQISSLRTTSLLYFPAGTPMDSLCTVIRRTEDVTRCNKIEPYIEELTIYNLDDTTSIRKGIAGEGIWGRESAVDDFLYVLYEYDKNKNDEVHWTYKLTINDSLLSLMEKDTSMLSLFPEYYGNNHTNPQK